MSLVICCPCGNPLDCDNLELVVSLVCPRCDRELLLEVADKDDVTSRAILTIMEGPRWIGERFLLPVGVDLAIGATGGNWLSLEDDNISDEHCKLHFTESGRVSIEDLCSASGTWIADQRILRGRLQPCQSFKLGDFRFRLDFQAPDGAPAPAVGEPVEDLSTRNLPTLDSVTSRQTPARWLIRDRFRIARTTMLVYAWLVAVHHACWLQLQEPYPWSPLAACLTGAGMLIGLTICCHRVTFAHKYCKFASIAVLVLLAAVDLAIGIHVPAVAALGLAATLALLIVRAPPESAAIPVALLGLAALTTTVVVTIQSLTSLFAARF